MAASKLNHCLGSPITGRVSGHLEDLLNCSICLELLVEPKLLPCGHSFCEKCLVPLVENRKLLCPTCRGVVRVPRGVKRIPSDIRTKAMLEEVLGQREPVESPPSYQTCTICAVEKSTAMCFDCKAGVCSECVPLHNVKTRSQHMMVTIEGLEVCPVHWRPCGYVCKECKNVVCDDCCFEKNSCLEHETETLVDALASNAPVTQYTDVFPLIYSTWVLRRNVIDSIEAFQRDISLHARRLIRDIEKNRDKLLKEVNTQMYNQKVQEFEYHIDDWFKGDVLPACWVDGVFNAATIYKIVKGEEITRPEFKLKHFCFVPAQNLKVGELKLVESKQNTDHLAEEAVCGVHRLTTGYSGIQHRDESLREIKDAINDLGRLRFMFTFGGLSLLYGANDTKLGLATYNSLIFAQYIRQQMTQGRSLSASTSKRLTLLSGISSFVLCALSPILDVEELTAAACGSLLLYSGLLMYCPYTCRRETIRPIPSQPPLSPTLITPIIIRRLD